MIPSKNFKSTSTPFERSSFESNDDGDSAYHSNSSAADSSVGSNYTASQSRLLFLNSCKTPEVSADSAISIESADTSTFLLDELPKYFQVCRPRQSLAGKEYVDFLYNLGEKSDYTMLLKKIFEHLSDEDLYNASAVSKCWKNVILSISVTKRRLRHYMKKIELTKENRNLTGSNEFVFCEDRTSLPNPRVRLIQIQNIRRTSTSSSSPASTNSSPGGKDFLFETYRREGQKLKPKKRLFSCPRCKLPSHVDENVPQTAECINNSCRYRFCILCECVEHPQKICHFISTPVVRKQSSLVGTKNSKKNLKRLLM